MTALDHYHININTPAGRARDADIDWSQVDEGMIDDAVEKAVGEAVAEMQARVDALTARVQKIMDAKPRTAPPPGYVRDAGGTIRPRTTRDLQAANDAAWDGKGKAPLRPGDASYAVEPVVPHATSPADLQANADAYWGRKIH